MSQRDVEIANTILDQLGGGRFAVMTGARNFAAIENGLRFMIPGNMTRDRINLVEIVLDASDTYTVTFSRARGGRNPSVKEVYSQSFIYADMLRDLFEDRTGLRTSL